MFVVLRRHALRYLQWKCTKMSVVLQDKLRSENVYERTVTEIIPLKESNEEGIMRWYEAVNKWDRKG